MNPEWIEDTTTAAVLLLTSYGPIGLGWGSLCTKLVCRNYERRDGLHRILHKIAVPTIIPEQGRGRKGTLWRL